MRNITFDMADMHLHGPAFYDFLKLRKRYFVDGLAWNLPNDGEVEMDQYDIPPAQYSLVERDGRIIAGARTLPTATKWGFYTCMLNDAAEGRLAGVPANLFDPSLRRNDVWECTRLVISDDVATADERTRCLALIVDGLVRRVVARGGTEMISLSPLPLQRALRSLGYDVERASDPYTSEHDGRSYAVLKMPARRAVEVLRSLGLDAEEATDRRATVRAAE